MLDGSTARDLTREDFELPGNGEPRTIVLRSGSGAAWLGLDIEAGDWKFFSTVAGQMETFGYIVQIETLGIAVESMVNFLANDAMTKTVLGRTGWLDRLRPGIVDHEQTL